VLSGQKESFFNKEYAFLVGMQPNRPFFSMSKRMRISESTAPDFGPEPLPPTPKNTLSLLPNEVLLCVFDYLSPFDLVRAFDYDWIRYGDLVAHHIVQQGLNLLRVEPSDIHLLPTCLSLIEHQHLNVYVHESQLLVLLQTAVSLRTLLITLDMPRETSALSMLQQGCISCEQLIVQCKSNCYRPLSMDQILPLLSTSVHTLILRNMLCLVDDSPTYPVWNFLHHVRCMLKTETDLHALLVRLPMLQSIDIRLVVAENHMHSQILPLPRHFRIEYASSMVVDLNRFPEKTRIYDQTVYSLPWLPTNTSLLLRSCDSNNYLGSFPHPILCIRRLTIDCRLDPWPLEFVVFLRQTFPNTRILYAIQGRDSWTYAMTVITVDDRKSGACTLYRLDSKSKVDETFNSNALHFVNADNAYN
jgi:hypothetical protein